ncbi:MAG TPA: glycine zipper 2TM domain-containing protein [Usitatibacter sp.]|nr:glycine zipper 2TM domain-containing protein [Usitatibacter sp.]
MTRHTMITAAALSALLLGGCAYNAGSRDYRGYQVMGEQSVRFGVVESVRGVNISPRETGVGTAGGAVLGGLAGSQIGQGSGQVAGAVGGAILGGILGSNIERSGNQRAGVEITVQLDSGKYVAIVQDADEQFRPGDRVRVLTGRGTTRVTH